MSVSSTTNTIEKSGGWDGWNAGASSISAQSIVTGTNGYVESVAVSRSYHTIFGLSHTDANQDYTTIDYAIHLQGTAEGWPGDLVIYESGTAVANFGLSYVAGDVLRVAVAGGVVKYYKNGHWLRTSTQTPSFPLVFDGSVFHTGAKVKDAFICRTRPQATPQRTLYIGGLYEEELPGAQNPPYTSYYTFGSKMVGMRRANAVLTSVSWLVVIDPVEHKVPPNKDALKGCNMFHV